MERGSGGRLTPRDTIAKRDGTTEAVPSIISRYLSRGRYPLFGTLEGESAETAFVRLNAFGRRVRQMLSGLPQFYEGRGYSLKVLARMVMPDHVHLVIQVLEPLPQSIGAVVRGFKSGRACAFCPHFCGQGQRLASGQGLLPRAHPACTRAAAPDD